VSPQESDQNQQINEPSNPRSWEGICKDLKELENVKNFEYELLLQAKKNGFEPEQYRKIYNEFYTEKRLSTKLDNLLGLWGRLTALAGVLAAIWGILTYLPTQKSQSRTETARKNIEQERANYEAWGIINSNRVDIKGNIVRASSGRITALQNLNNNRVPMHGLEVPGTLLLRINLRGAQLYQADFRGADLYLANFNSRPARNNPSVCSWPEWTQVTQIYECASNEELQERRTELERADFRGATLNGATFNRVGMVDDKILGPAVDLFRANFSPLNPDLSPINLTDEQLLAIECFSDEPVLLCARAVNTSFIGANLQYANFRKANLKGANFRNANLQCASFRGAVFNPTNDSDPNLTGVVAPTSFEGADIRGADFRDLAVPNPGKGGDKIRGLTPRQIKQAKNWQQARYSPDFLQALGLSSQFIQPYKCESYPDNPFR
jgi:uncharacterized protein YjbI with pentapeptide repeats